jgi:agmatine deiminase
VNILEKNNAYRLPAEWEEQEAVWFAWTTRQDLWKGYTETIQNRFSELYLLCSNFQKVNILCAKNAQSDLNQLLDRHEHKNEIKLHAYETDDVWIRDYGPIFLKHENENRLISSDWVFNAWGGKFELFQKDNGVPKWLSGRLDIENISYPQILEGGAVEVNGEGLLCTTKNVLMNANRIIGNESIDWDEFLQEALGVKSTLWFENGLYNDDTDGHIDNILRFAPGHRIIYASESDKKNPNFIPLKQIKDQLNTYAKSLLNGYKYQELPIPDPIFVNGVMVSASYLNYLVINGAVIVPCFAQAKDKTALSVIKSCFPDREVIGFNCLEIIREGGGLHCLSLNQPLINQ